MSKVPMHEAVIHCEALGKTYSEGTLNTPVFDGLDLAVHAGETVAILGASGAGKSTLLHLLGGLDTPTAGEVYVAGLLGTVGHFMFIRAFQHAPASALTPFTYLQLVWATLIGWAAFDRFPDRYALAGMGVITCSGLLVALHERRRARAALAQPPVVD